MEKVEIVIDGETEEDQEDRKGIYMRKFFIFIISLCIFAFSGCTKKDVDKNIWRQSTDLKYIKQKFTYLCSIEKTQWEQKTISEGGIGPGRYEIRGFIMISPDDTRNLKKEFKWIEIDAPVSFSIEIDPDWPRSVKWLSSKEFNLRAKTGSWVGEIYFLPEYRTLYFSIQN